MSLLMALALACGAAPVILNGADLATMTDVLPVDARDAASFAAGHIPGAANLDVASLSETRDGVIGMLKPHEDLVPLFAAAGLSPDKTLVVYSGLENADDVKQATRLFWALEYSGYARVRLLDGGLAKWKAEGGAVEKGKSTISPIAGEALADLKRAEARETGKKALMDVLDRGTGVVVDLRSKDDYTGASKRDFVGAAGHIPSAKSKPATTFVEGAHFTFKAPEALRELIGSSPRAGDKPVIAYCNSGRDATVGYVAYRAAGFENVSVYDGSMAEWGNDASCPVADGEE